RFGIGRRLDDVRAAGRHMPDDTASPAWAGPIVRGTGADTHADGDSDEHGAIWTPKHLPQRTAFDCRQPGRPTQRQSCVVTVHNESVFVLKANGAPSFTGTRLWTLGASRCPESRIRTWRLLTHTHP